MLFDIVGRRYLFFAISLLIMIPGIIGLALGGLRPGIDFTGGTFWEVIPQPGVDLPRVREVLAEAGHPEVAVVQAELSGGGVVTPTIQMRMKSIDEREKALIQDAFVRQGVVAGTVTTSTLNLSQDPGAAATPAVTGTATVTGTVGTVGTVQQLGRFAEGQEIQYYKVGPVVGQQVTNNAVLAVALTSLGILIYLWFAFRRVQGALRYGVAAVIALVHDAIVVLGIFALLGLFFGIEIDALFVTAMLTVIGFSVHDSIVVFDRIRENQLKRRFDTFDKVVNYSLLQTLARSITTSLTTVITLAAIYLFGGVTIRNFILALLIGIISGTYSSIFNASLLLVLWENRDWRNWFGRRGEPTPGEAARTA
jgi:preprotein translocase subunit SecF